MITDAEYLQIISENYDLSDYNNQKQYLLCSEQQKTINIENIVGKIYNHIRNNITAIDFGTIPKSKGVVTKVENYSQIVECLSSIRDLIIEYHENTSTVDEVTTALANIQSREREFAKSFALGIDCPMMIYNMTMTSIISATSLLISTCVEYVKNGHDSFSVSLDTAGYKKSRDHIMYKYLHQFNSTCKDGTIDKLIDECIKNNVVATKESYVSEGSGAFKAAAVTGATLAGKALANHLSNSGGLTASGLMRKGFDKLKDSNTPTALKVVSIIIIAGAGIVILFKLLKQLIYWTICTRMKVSDWFEIQATYLQINAENLKYRYSEDDERINKVYQSQIRWVERFRNLSNKLAIKDTTAQKDARDSEREDSYNDDYDDGGLF